MVSFSCEACGDILKKPKLDQHAGRCRGAYYTCVDCNNTFDGRTGPNGYSTHTSCMSEEQRYHKRFVSSSARSPNVSLIDESGLTNSVYKEPKKKGNKQQQNQQQNQTSQPTETASAPVQEKEDSKKRAREEESSKKVEEPTVNDSKEKVEETKKEEESSKSTEEEPSKKKKKKNKKNKDESTAATTGEEPKKETLSSFLSATLPSLLAESVSIVTLREKVVGQAKVKGFTDEKEVEKALFEGMTVGGKKSKVKYEFA
ncbi:hypothetical protein JCM5353_001426 [Sporobolomyces roseus]